MMMNLFRMMTTTTTVIMKLVMTTMTMTTSTMTTSTMMQTETASKFHRHYHETPPTRIPMMMTFHHSRWT
jgi:hypothetical protein